MGVDEHAYLRGKPGSASAGLARCPGWGRGSRGQSGDAGAGLSRSPGCGGGESGVGGGRRRRSGRWCTCRSCGRWGSVRGSYEPSGRRWGRCIGCCPSVFSVVASAAASRGRPRPRRCCTPATTRCSAMRVPPPLWGLDRNPLLRGHHDDWPARSESAGAAGPPGQGPGHPRRADPPGLSGDLPGADADRLRRGSPGDRPVAQRGAGAEAGQGRRDPGGDGSLPGPQGCQGAAGAAGGREGHGVHALEGRAHPEADREEARASSGPSSTRYVEGVEVDAYWPRLKLVIEVDGYQTHGHYQAFQRDRAKANRLVGGGLCRAPVHLAPAHPAADAGGRRDRPDAGPPRGAGGLNTDMQPLQSGRAGMLSGHAVLGRRALVPGGDGGRRGGDAAGGAAGPTAGRGGPPRERGLSQRPTPLLGGLAILAAVLVAGFIWLPPKIFLPHVQRTAAAGRAAIVHMWAVIAGACLITLVGAIDDVRRPAAGRQAGRPDRRGAHRGRGRGGGHRRDAAVPRARCSSPTPAACSRSIWLVGLMNVVNFSDGVDGLAAGLCAIDGVAFAVIAFDLGVNGAPILAAHHRRRRAGLPLSQLLSGLGLHGRRRGQPAGLPARGDGRGRLAEDQRVGRPDRAAGHPRHPVPGHQLRHRQAAEVPAQAVVGRRQPLPPPDGADRVLPAQDRRLPVRVVVSDGGPGRRRCASSPTTTSNQAGWIAGSWSSRWCAPPPAST